jgi:MFS family permease
MSSPDRSSDERQAPPTEGAQGTFTASLRGLGRPFLLLWVGQTVSMVGSSLSGFAMGVWIFQHNQRVLDFAGMAVVGVLPMLLIAPWAGHVVDRFDRRYVALAADGVAALSTCIAAMLLWQDALQIWHLYLIGLVGSTAGAFQAPAFQALAAQVLPRDQMPRASGLMGVSGNVVGLGAPLAAGALMGSVGLPGILAIDLVTYCFASALVFRVFSALAALGAGSPPPAANGRPGVVASFVEALGFFREHRLMMGLLGYSVLQASLVGGVGGLLGSSYLVIRQSCARLTVGVLGCDAVISTSVRAAGLQSTLVAYAGCLFIASAAAALAMGYGGALWMRKVPAERRGRIFVATGTIHMLVGPAVALTGGFAADRLFEPALAPGGSLAASVGPWLGRGLALVFVLCGAAGLMLSLAALAHAGLRNADRLVPDAA